MGLALVDGIAAVGAVDVAAVGLSSLGRPDGWLDRQPGRWLSQLQSYEAVPGWSLSSQIPVGRLAAWLQARVPGRWLPGLIHGDYHFGNVLFDRRGPDLAAIVDWELATIGDPLLDLGHLLATWADEADDQTPATVLYLPGLPGRSVLVERYAAASARDLSRLDWYIALACFRLGVLLEGTHARSLAGLAPPEVGERLHRMAMALWEQGLLAAAA
jgi:aminoglycoside phosphotransferase (APT) family kinase protein